MRSLALVSLLFVVACMPAGQGRPSQRGTTRLGLTGTAMIAQAGTLISAPRAGAGVLAPVVQNPALQAAAQAHADDLAATGRFSHTGSGGSTLSSRVRASGYNACFAAENIAQGQPSVGAVVSSWSNSPGHYRNMVNPGAQQFGFARAGDVWVLVLARPC